MPITNLLLTTFSPFRNEQFNEERISQNYEKSIGSFSSVLKIVILLPIKEQLHQLRVKTIT